MNLISNLIARAQGDKFNRKRKRSTKHLADYAAKRALIAHLYGVNIDNIMPSMRSGFLRDMLAAWDSYDKFNKEIK